MNWLSSLVTRIPTLFRKRQLDAELDDELRFHLEMEEQENIRNGMNAEEARRQARLRLGGMEQVKEEYRDRRGIPFLESLLQDLRFAFRSFRRDLGFTATVLVTLALGLGFNTAIFSIVNAALLRPLPYQEPETLISICETYPDHPGRYRSASTADIQGWQQAGAFESIAAASYVRDVNLTDEGSPERIASQPVTANLFPTLGLEPVVGRQFFTEDEGRSVVILSHEFWQRRFGGAADIIGKTLPMNGVAQTVIGVMPPGVAEVSYWRGGNRRVDLWVPLSIAKYDASLHYLSVVGRLQSGATLEEAQVRINGAVARMRETDPKGHKDHIVLLEPIHEHFLGRTNRSLYYWLIGSGIVLLLAWVNVAGLMMARSVSRVKEMATRAALGCGRLRLVRQILTETVLISLAGGALGLVLTVWSTQVFATMAANSSFARVREIPIDIGVAGYALAISVLTGLMFGLGPALRASRLDLNVSLKDTGRFVTGGPGASRGQNVMVVVQIAAAVVLFTAAGLMTKSFVESIRIDPGFNTRHLLTFQIALPLNEYSEREGHTDDYLRYSPKIEAFFSRVEDKLRSVPGVTSAAVAACPPLANDVACLALWLPVSIRGRDSAENPQKASRLPVSPEYFSTMGITLLRGRSFNDRDTAEAPWVTIVNETMVRQFWPNDDPLGQWITIGNSDWERPRQVVGVAADARVIRQWQDPPPLAYIPHSQRPTLDRPWRWQQRVKTSFVIRSAMDAESLVPAFRRAVAEVDPRQPVYGLQTVDQDLADSYGTSRFLLSMAAAICFLAMFLAAIGIHGLMAFSVSQRTREFGIRIALGAEKGQVVADVLKRALQVAGIGLGLGVVGAWVASRVIVSTIWGTVPYDTGTFVAVLLFFLLVALLASYRPARRAAKVDPIVALRHD